MPGRIWKTGFVALVVLMSWAASAFAATIAVEVDGECFDVAAIERRVRDIHRAKPRMRASGDHAALSVRDIVDALVDEHLFAREAEAMGLGEDPAFLRRLRAYERDRAIVMLHRIVVEAEPEPGEEDVHARYEAMTGRKAGEEGISEMDATRIRDALRRERQKQRADAFVEGLRENADIEVDQERLAVLPASLALDDGHGYVAVVDGLPIHMDVFLEDLRRELAKARTMPHGAAQGGAGDARGGGSVERVLDALVTNALVGAEAVRRGYCGAPEVVDAVARRKRAMLLRAFRDQVLQPMAEPADAELRAFYDANPSLYTHGCEVRLGQLRFKDRGEAEAMLRELRGGAVFAHLAKTLGGRSSAGDGWVGEDSLPGPFQEALDGLSEGGVSDVVALGRDMVILKLRARRGCTVAPYAEVAADVERRVRAAKFERERERYAAALRERARIVEHDDVLKGLEEMFWTEPEGAAHASDGGGQ